MKIDKNDPGTLQAIRSDVDRERLLQFLGAVQTRIADCQGKFWSRFLGTGWIAEDIHACWPEDNMRFFTLAYSGIHQSLQLRDLNLRELEELAKWLADYLASENDVERKANQ